MHRRHLVVAALAVALLPLVACSRDGSWDRASCSPARPAEPGTRPMEVSGGRQALVHVPEGYDGTEEQPVVVTLHSYGSSAEEHLDYTQMVPVADDESFVLLAPQASGTPPRFDQEIGITSDADDVAFVVSLLDQLSNELCVDASRVYAVGQSNGAGLAAVLGCREPTRFAAIAMSSLLLLPEGCEQPAPAVLAYMGTQDITIPYAGGHVDCCVSGGFDVPPADMTMAAWAAHAGCESTEPDVDDEGDGITRRVWSDCGADGDREVRYYVIDGGGHTWPGADTDVPFGETTQALDAATETWSFFRRYSLPGDDTNR